LDLLRTRHLRGRIEASKTGIQLVVLGSEFLAGRAKDIHKTQIIYEEKIRYRNFFLILTFPSFLYSLSLRSEGFTLSVLEVCRQGITTTMAPTTQNHSDLLVDPDEVPVIGEQDRSETSSQDDAALLKSMGYKPVCFLIHNMI
jgi:hypothetical protein